MQILSPEGNANGLGKFTFKNSGYDIIDERFSGGQSYQIVGGEVNLTESSSTKIVGSYNVLLKSGSNTKSATGTFTINQPIQ
jgi:hypothetical protein